MGKYIVRNSGEYVVEEHESMPVNCILSHPTAIGGKSLFTIVGKRIDFVWKSSYYIQICHNDFYLHQIPPDNLLLVCDYMKKYESMSESDFEELYNEKLNQTKTELEKEVETLARKKKELMDEISIYKKIKRKKEELDKLLEKLNDKNN